MSKLYVPNSLSEYLGESKSITLKRKYGERPSIQVGTMAPLRNQVLSYVAENLSVSKLDLKRFIVGLKEGGATPASANMFIKRNAKYFLTENRAGVTYFKLSPLGKRLVGQFKPVENTILENQHVNEKFEKSKKIPEMAEDFLDDEDKDEPASDVDFEEGDRFGDEDDIKPDAEIDDVDEDPDIESAEEGGEKEDEDDNFEYFEDDEKIVLTYYKDGTEKEDEDEDEDAVIEPDEEDELNDKDLDDDEDLEKEPPEDELEETLDRPTEPTRHFDFKDKGRKGVVDAYESVTEDESNSQLEQIVENIKAARKAAKLNEAETKPDEKDELSDDDLKSIGGEEPPENEKTDDDDLDLENPEDEVEKTEITEFIITVDDVDSAIDELKELGVSAEKVPVEPKEDEELPLDLDEPEEEKPAEEDNENPVDEIPEEPKPEEKSNESLMEADDKPDPGISDELDLGDQGADAKELEDKPENLEPTAEFEENKIKVPAESWPKLKGWLEEKGVDVKEMFGGDIEMEEVPDEVEGEEGDKTGGEISDDDVDFSGVGDDEKTKVEEKPEEKKE